MAGTPPGPYMYVELVAASGDLRLLHRIKASGGEEGSRGPSFPLNFGREMCIRTGLVKPEGSLLSFCYL